MRKHFIVLVVGSVIFLIALVRATWERWLGGSDSGLAAARNSAAVLDALQVFGLYVVFAVLVLAHALLPRRSVRVGRTNEADEGA